MSEEKSVLMIHERWSESLIKDAGSFATVTGIIGLGWWLGSDAMQWVGFIMVCLVALARLGSMKAHSGKWRYTPQEAADYLSATYGVKAKE